MFCSSRRKSPGLSTKMMEAFLFPDILIIYENKNKAALLACQMEIFLRGEWQETGCSQTGKSHIIIQDLFVCLLKKQERIMPGKLPSSAILADWKAC